MYLLFREKRWNPMKYMDMGYGERRVIRAFMHQEIEERNEEYERAVNNEG